MRSDKKERKKTTYTSNIRLYCILWAFLSIVFATIILVQISREAKISADAEAIGRQISEADNEIQTLQSKIGFNKSDRAIEEYAHKECGLAYPYEIIIYNDNYKPNK